MSDDQVERLMPTVVFLFTWTAVLTLLLGLFNTGLVQGVPEVPNGLTVIGGVTYERWNPTGGRVITVANVSDNPEPPGDGKTMHFQSPSVAQTISMTVVRNNSLYQDWNPFTPAEWKKDLNTLAFYEPKPGGFPWEIFRKSLSYETIEQLHNNTPTATTVSIVIFLDQNYTVSITVANPPLFHDQLYNNTFTVQMMQVYVPDYQTQEITSWTSFLSQLFTLQFNTGITDPTANAVFNLLIVGPFYIAIIFIGIMVISRLTPW